MKTIKFNGYLLPNVGAITTAVSDDVKKEYIRLIQKAFGGEYKFGAGANIYGVSDSTDWCNWVALDLEESNKLFTLLPISLATTWLKVALREITRENFCVDLNTEKDHPKLEEFKKWLIRERNFPFSFNDRFYGVVDGLPRSVNTEDRPDVITLDIFFTYFYEQAEKPKYVTGQRFKAKIQGKKYDELTIKPCEDVFNCWDLFNGDTLITCIGYGDAEGCKVHKVTELELLPDPAEPVKGDEIEVSDNGVKWSTNVNKNYTRIYTGYQKKNGYYVYDYDGEIFSCKHIRLASSPEKLKREEAMKQAREFLEASTSFSVLEDRVLEALTEYILKEKM